MGESSPPLSPAAILRIDRVLKALDDNRVASIVEVGPGLGAASWYLAQGRKYVGYEPDAESHEVAAERLSSMSDVALVNAQIPETPTGSFDALVALEVLEHISDDGPALENWAKWVRPGGLVVISVPAHQSRFGPMDEAVGHYRRYERPQLASLMADAGLTGVSISAYGMPIGYLLEWVRNRFLSRRMGSVSVQEGTARSGRSFQPRSGGRLIRALMFPFRLMQRPFDNTDLGIGWVAWGTRGF
jgi:SAM-dependent methyltransferase